MFVQDDWKLSQRLTVNLGFRDDIYTPDTDKNNKLANFDYSKMAFVFAGMNGTSKSAGIQQRNNDFGPRVGLAFDLDGKGTTVIRAGFGIDSQRLMSWDRIRRSRFHKPSRARRRSRFRLRLVTSALRPTLPQHVNQSLTIPSRRVRFHCLTQL